MLSRLTGPAAANGAMQDLFADAALIRAALDFEAALARACAAEGLLSDAERDAIGTTASVLDVDVDGLASRAHHAGTLAIALVESLRTAVGESSPSAATKVHLGATSQDLADSVCAVQCRRATQLLVEHGSALCQLLADLAERHAATPMLGRTLLRGALPISFGLKAANWLVGLSEALARLRSDTAVLACQLGGAAGTLSGLDGRGLAVASRLAAELALSEPVIPWHARRIDVVALGASLALVAGALAKIARDLGLLGQDEIGEAFEAPPPGRGGSSAMPHKRNATGARQALTAVARVPGLAATLMTGMAQEHERGFGGWQAELGILGEMYVWTDDAMLLLTGALDGLEVDASAMRRNLEAAAVGGDYGEAEALVVRAVGEYRRVKESWQ